MTKEVSLLAYIDRLAGDLRGLATVLDSELGPFTGVHLLPFFVPIDGRDAGFDPIDHTRVDPRLGDWSDVRRIAESRAITADLIVNHVSARSPQFTDWLARGDDSAWAGMFLTFDDVFPTGATADQITSFYRPRQGLPFTAYQRGDGSPLLMWTTFDPSQIDLNVASDEAWDYLDGVLDTMASAGVRTVRLDAVGYAVKTPGTDSFMTAHTLEYVDEITGHCRDRGLSVLVEVHSHFRDQLAIAQRVDWIYDFALPPLLLLAVYTGSLDELTSWLRVRPDNCISVLDTHDGIGVVDACGNAVDPAGLITEPQAELIFAEATARTGGLAAEASTLPQFARRPHQINSTFADVLGRDDETFLACRIVQLFLPGQAHVYYVGLYNGRNAPDLWRRTGVGREINRHYYGDDERRVAGEQPFTRALLALVRLVTTHPAFDGTFGWTVEGNALSLGWSSGRHTCTASVVFHDGRADFRIDDGRRVASSVTELAAW